MKFIVTVSIVILFFSCKDNQEKFTYQTSIASKIYEAQSKYFDQTLLIYARISDQGKYFYNESQYLDKISNELKEKLMKGSTISKNDEASFFEHFEKTFTNHALIDTQVLIQLKELPIKTFSDIDLLKLYVKNNYVCILLNNKLLPFDTWGARVYTNKTELKDGEEFQAYLVNIATGRSVPTEWYLLKEDTHTLEKENIIDTLHPNMFGEVDFKTKKYKKGLNRLTFFTRLNKLGDPVMSMRKEVEFYVK